MQVALRYRKGRCNLSFNWGCHGSCHGTRFILVHDPIRKPLTARSEKALYGKLVEGSSEGPWTSYNPYVAPCPGRPIPKHYTFPKLEINL